jgi:hypothetical protein
MRLRGQAYLMAAVATYLAGDESGAVDLALEGQSWLPPFGDPERDPFQRFLDDPDAFCERFAGGAAGLESRLMELEAELEENE